MLSENDPIECDLVAVMKAVFLTQIVEVSRKLKVTRRSIDRAERLRGRFRRNKPSQNAIERVLESEIAVLKRSACRSEAALKQRQTEGARLRTTLRLRFRTRAPRTMTVSRCDSEDGGGRNKSALRAFYTLLTRGGRCKHFLLVVAKLRVAQRGTERALIA